MSVHFGACRGSAEVIIVVMVRRNGTPYLRIVLCDERLEPVADVQQGTDD
jgi:hypothetical protein